MLSSAQAAYDIYGGTYDSVAGRRIPTTHFVLSHTPHTTWKTTASMNAWCVKDLTNFAHVFSAYRNPTAALFFREPVYLWDVSKGVDFRHMFAGCSFFDGENLGQWNVSNAQFMDSMFEKTSTVSQFIGDLSSWNVEKVQTTERMFAGSKITFGSTNDISRWKLRSIRSAKSMFEGNIRFQYDLCSWGEYFAMTSTSLDENEQDLNSNDQTAVSVDRMFATTSCIYSDQSTSNPNLSIFPPGPFCHQCNDESKTSSIKNNDRSGGKGYNKTKRDQVFGIFLIILAIIISSSYCLNSF
jgi:hypothetical protein